MKALIYRFVLPALITPLYLFLRITWRIKVHGPEGIVREYVDGGKSVVFAHWHGDELALVGHYAFKRLCVLSSLSSDGTLMASTLKLLGYRVFRGSSSRGGARGLISLIKAAKSGAQTALAVDGPKGPIYEVKAGVVDLAQRTQLPVLCVRSRASHFWLIPRAWNKSYLPKPFSRVDVYYSSLLHLKENESLEQRCAQVKQALDKLLTE